MRNEIRFLLIIISIWIVLVLMMVLTPGCSVYSAKVGDVELWSGRLLMFDTKTGLTVDAVDPNFNSILITLDKASQHPDANSIKSIAEGISYGVIEGLK